MSRLNAFLLVLNVALVGACYDGNDLTTDAPPKQVLPPSGYSHPSSDAGVPAAVTEDYRDFLEGKPGPVRPTIVRRGEAPPVPQAGPVELRQLRLDTNPPMGVCPDFGAAYGPGWTEVFRFGSPYSNVYPGNQPNNCRMLPPQSNYPNLGYFAYPSGQNMNDKIRAFFAWANPMQCVRVTFTEHDWGGPQLAYQVCAPTNDTATVWSGDVVGDGGGNFWATQAKVEWWAY